MRSIGLITVVLVCGLAMTAVAGEAYYGGFVGDTGVAVAFSGIPTPPDTATWAPMNGYYDIQETGGAGRVKYHLTENDGSTVVTVPGGGASVYYVYGKVQNPGAFADSRGQNYRFYVGIDPASAGYQIGVIGIDSTGSAWVFGSDNSALVGNQQTTDDTGATILGSGVNSWTTLEFMASRNATGDLILQYKKDGGAWAPFWVNNGIQSGSTTNGTIPESVLTAYSIGGGTDSIQVDFRSWPHAGPIVIDGDSGVPNVNTTADYDGDGVTNAQEFLNGTDPTYNAATPMVVSVTGGGTVYVGDSVTLTANVTNVAAPLTYAWKKVGGPTVLSTASTLTIASAALTDTGSYNVTVTDSTTPTPKTGTSSDVALTVSTPPPNLPALGYAGIALLLALCAAAGVFVIRKRAHHHA